MSIEATKYNKTIHLFFKLTPTTTLRKQQSTHIIENSSSKRSRYYTSIPSNQKTLALSTLHESRNSLSHILHQNRAPNSTTKTERLLKNLLRIVPLPDKTPVRSELVPPPPPLPTSYGLDHATVDDLFGSSPIHLLFLLRRSPSPLTSRTTSAQNHQRRLNLGHGMWI
ncbi:hypothetical protein Droror1_Dr00000805 [Drosera rotundifolia]